MSTIYEVAKKARTTASTVSKALNNKGYVSAETKQRIEKAARELNYTPHFLAQSLKTKKTNVVGVLIPDIANPIYPAFIKGVYNICKNQGYHLIIGNSYGDPGEELNILKTFNSGRVDGFILMAAEAEEDKAINKYLSEVSKSDLPMVICGRKGSTLPADRVNIDNAKGVSFAINHLIDCGHNSIAFINGPKEVIAAQERQKAYEKALLEQHVLINEKIIKNSEFTQEGGYRATKELLSGEESFTAVFAANDLMALGAILAIEEKGLKIPQDIAIVGFDDISLASVVRPRLTTVAQPKEEAGKIIADLLLARINGTASDIPQNILLEPRLVIRESTIRIKGYDNNKDMEG